jgi:2-oxoisovalerate dehydrogenase E1 component alpha subunit
LTESPTTIDAPARHREAGLVDSDVIEMYRLMVLCRTFDEHMWHLHRAGQISGLHMSAMGHEATQVGSAYAFERGVDYFNPYYRGLATALTVGTTVRELMLPYYGRAEDPSGGGRQIMGHYGNRRLNIVSQSSSVATQIPHAVGIAFAAKYRGDPVVSHVSFGEGGSSKGDFHEGLNFAGIHKLPVVFICENNRYAISVPVTQQMAVENVADRAACYGMPGVVVNGQDVVEVYRVTREAVDRARRGDGPTLIECKTYRLVPHSTSDDDRFYRSREEVAEWRERDPILVAQHYLSSIGLWSVEREAQLREECLAEVKEAQAYCEQAADPKPEDVLRPVYADT